MTEKYNNDYQVGVIVIGNNNYELRCSKHINANTKDHAKEIFKKELTDAGFIFGSFDYCDWSG